MKIQCFPTKSQWSNWSLPSKAGYLGLILAIVGLLLTTIGLLITVLYSHYQSSQAQQREQRIVGKFEELFIQNEAEWLLKYPSGFIMFGLRRTKIVESISSSLSSKYRINWENARLEEITDTSLVVKLPDITWRTYNVSFPTKTLIANFPDSIKGGVTNTMDIGLPDKICAEVVDVGSTEKMLVVGFKPGRAQPPP